jgi:YgiT-type zinc finger domain-containing protein
MERRLQSEEERMTCVICRRGHTEPGVVTVTLERGATVVIVRETPAAICTTCGEHYLDETVTKRVFAHAEDAVKRRADVEILRYAAAADRDCAAAMGHGRST